MIIPFSIPTSTNKEKISLLECLEKNITFSGGGEYQLLCRNILKKILNTGNKIYLTPSCTQSLEASSLILNLKAGDEVIMPSYTFVTSATSFVNRGINVKFVDIKKDTLNIDETKIEQAINKKTKAIVVVHYAGVSCEMDSIMKIAKKYNLFVIEDAAQSMISYYKGKHTGTFGDVAAFSYHDTKNLHCGEGGSLIVNNKNYFDIADIVTEKGTNRTKFLEGNIEKYTWISLGSSYAMNELSAAYLLQQLKHAHIITNKRKKMWERYYFNLKDVTNIDLPIIPEYCNHNGHIFYIMTKEPKVRINLLRYLKSKGVKSSLHFTPLHSSLGSKGYCEFIGEDNYTTYCSSRLLRLPIFDAINTDQIDYVCDNIRRYYSV